VSTRIALPVVAAEPGTGAARAVCRAILADAREVAAQWRAVLADDGCGPLPVAMEPLPAEVAALALEMLDGGDDDAASADLTEAAMLRGEQLQADGLRHRAVMRLHFLLREAIWRAVQRTAASPTDAERAITWFDLPLTLAASATLAAIEDDSARVHAFAAA
jgi:hypothetical protein